jgi:hypothetical protein
VGRLSSKAYLRRLHKRILSHRRKIRSLKRLRGFSQALETLKKPKRIAILKKTKRRKRRRNLRSKSSPT